jgi:NAD(P)-dependent dehydrogenase (short-subunit alcohol dehydrogenase family)
LRLATLDDDVPQRLLEPSFPPCTTILRVRPAISGTDRDFSASFGRGVDRVDDPLHDQRLVAGDQRRTPAVHGINHIGDEGGDGGRKRDIRPGARRQGVDDLALGSLDANGERIEPDLRAFADGVEAVVPRSDAGAGQVWRLRVTGGGSGIGLETALTLADLGADVAILDWTPGAAAAAATEVRRIGRQSLAIEGDTGDEATVVKAFRDTASQLGPVDVAVACAGVLGTGGPVFETTVADFEQVMGVNVRGSFLVIREAAKQMRPRKSGAIVLLSSLDGLQAEHGMFSYCASKGALLNIARAAALDLARDRVTVNAVCPSVTITPLLEGRLASVPNGDEILAAYAERHPLGRVLRPRDIAAAIAFVSSEAANGITGAAIPVDAGVGATWDNFRDPPWVRQQVAGRGASA